MNEHVNKALKDALVNACDDLYRYELRVELYTKSTLGLQWALGHMASLREQIAALEAQLAK